MYMYVYHEPVCDVLTLPKLFSSLYCPNVTDWGEPERAPHLSNGVPRNLCIYLCIIRHSVNKCPCVLIHWTASILQCIINFVNAITFK